MKTSGSSSQITDLCEALDSNDAPDITKLSNEILNMFRTDDNPNDKDAYQRFSEARILYQSIMHFPPPYAVFYRIEDKTHMEELYTEAYFDIEEKFKDYVKQLGKAPDENEIKKGLENLKTDPIKTELVEAILQSSYLGGLKTDREFLIENTFNQIDSEIDIKDLAKKSFYGVPNFEQARNDGIIYKPDTHTWGVNAAWTLAITRQQIPVQILSELDTKSLTRSFSLRQPKGGLNPSAFALEIAIATKMGYNLTVNPNGGVHLTPPQMPGNHLTNGEPGNGVLPTKDDQLNIFQESLSKQFEQMSSHLLQFERNPNELQSHIHNVYMAKNEKPKKSLINTLQKMHEERSLEPVLNALPLQAHGELQKMLTSQPFVSNSSYDELRMVALEAKTNAMTIDVETNHGSHLKEYINTVCAGSDVSAKQQLIDTLNEMQQKNSNTTAVLTNTEKRALHALLQKNDFTDSKYDTLRTMIKPTPPPVPSRPRTSNLTNDPIENLLTSPPPSFTPSYNSQKSTSTKPLTNVTPSSYNPDDKKTDDKKTKPH